MRQLWGGSIGFEYDHPEDDKERQWFRQTIAPLSAEERRALLRRMTEGDGLERFLGLAFVKVKRFSIEGVDALVPMIDEAIARSLEANPTRFLAGGKSVV